MKPQHRGIGADERDPRRGVALIVALAVLALLMLMAAGFSITMRVERLGAGNYVQQAVRGQLAELALARVMSRIDNETGSGLYPDWELLASSGGQWSVQLGEGPGLDYVPGPSNLFNVARATESSWVRIAGAQVAYLVINESGLADANAAGGADRGPGADPTELAVDVYPSIGSVADFRDARDRDAPYLTLAEFTRLQRADGGLADPVNGRPDYLTVGSHSPHGLLTRAVDGTLEIRTDLVNLGVPYDEWDRDAILAALARSFAHLAPPPPQADLEFMYEALRDYVMPGPVSEHPDRLSRPMTKAVPMFNEVAVRIRMARTQPDRWRVMSNPTLELAYPFAAPPEPGTAFRVVGELQAELTVRDNTDPTIEVVYPHNALFDEPVDGLDLDYPAREYRLVNIPPFIVEPQGAYTNHTIEIAYTVLQAHVVVDGTPVDAFSFTDDPAQNLVTNMPVVIGPGGMIDVYPPSLEATDPRYNFESDLWVRERRFGPRTGPDRETSHTLGTRNHVTDWIIRDLRLPHPFDWSLKRHISGRDRLYSPLELANLPRSTDFRRGILQSIRLFDLPVGAANTMRPHDRVLEHFTCDPPVATGRVSLNTVQTNVLRSAFVRVPVAHPDGDVLASGTVDTVVDHILAWRDAGVVFTNVADVIYLSGLRTAAGLDDDEDEHDFTSLFTHTTGLLSTRQNQFTVLLGVRPDVRYAQIRDYEFAPELRAVARLWRDPFPVRVSGDPVNPVYRYNWRVEHFQWLAR